MNDFWQQVSEWCRKYPHGTAPNERDRQAIMAVYGLQEPEVVFCPRNQDAIEAAEVCWRRWPNIVPFSTIHPSFDKFCDEYVLLIGVPWDAAQLEELSRWVYDYVLFESEPTGRRNAYPTGGRTLTQFTRDVLFPIANERPDE